jgi:hypothetical protein
MKNLLVLSLIVLSFGSVIASELEGKADCADLNQSSGAKTESVQSDDPIGVKPASAVDG